MIGQQNDCQAFKRIKNKKKGTDIDDRKEKGLKVQEVEDIQKQDTAQL